MINGLCVELEIVNKVSFPHFLCPTTFDRIKTLPAVFPLGLSKSCQMNHKHKVQYHCMGMPSSSLTIFEFGMKLGHVVSKLHPMNQIFNIIRWGDIFINFTAKLTLLHHQMTCQLLNYLWLF